MNPYYTRLRTIDPTLYQDFKILSTQYVCAGTLSTYSYVDIDSNIIIPNGLQDQFFLTHLAMRGQIVPHRDQGIQCKINIYLSENQATTRFYTGDYKQIAKDCNGCNFEMFTSGNCACSLQPDNLVLVDQFTAHPGDVYLINTTQIHSVEELSADNPRFVLNLTTGMPYEAVYNLLQEHGLLDV
jgi:hypothetical protein